MEKNEPIEVWDYARTLTSGVKRGEESFVIQILKKSAGVYIVQHGSSMDRDNIQMGTLRVTDKYDDAKKAAKRQGFCITRERYRLIKHKTRTITPIDRGLPVSKRLADALDKPMNDSRIATMFTLRERIHAGYYRFAWAERVESLVFNQEKYDRMTTEERQKWDEKNKLGKLEYRFYERCALGRYQIVSRDVYNYFVSMVDNDEGAAAFRAAELLDKHSKCLRKIFDASPFATISNHG